MSHDEVDPRVWAEEFGVELPAEPLIEAEDVIPTPRILGRTKPPPAVPIGASRSPNPEEQAQIDSIDKMLAARTSRPRIAAPDSRVTEQPIEPPARTRVPRPRSLHAGTRLSMVAHRLYGRPVQAADIERGAESKIWVDILDLIGQLDVAYTKERAARIAAEKRYEDRLKAAADRAFYAVLLGDTTK